NKPVSPSPGFAHKVAQGKRSALLSQGGSTIETQSRSCEGRFQSRMLTRFAKEPPLARPCRAALPSRLRRALRYSAQHVVTITVQFAISTFVFPRRDSSDFKFFSCSPKYQAPTRNFSSPGYSCRMRLTFLGATETVTGSKFLLESA